MEVLGFVERLSSVWYCSRQVVSPGIVSFDYENRASVLGQVLCVASNSEAESTNLVGSTNYW